MPSRLAGRESPVLPAADPDSANASHCNRSPCAPPMPSLEDGRAATRRSDGRAKNACPSSRHELRVGRGGFRRTLLDPSMARQPRRGQHRPRHLGRMLDRIRQGDVRPQRQPDQQRLFDGQRPRSMLANHRYVDTVRSERWTHRTPVDRSARPDARRPMRPFAGPMTGGRS